MAEMLCVVTHTHTKNHCLQAKYTFYSHSYLPLERFPYNFRFKKGLRHLSAEKLLSVLGRICVFLFDRGHQEIWA